jgi:hypothetical protein
LEDDVGSGATKKAATRLGFMKGAGSVPDDFDRMCEGEIQKAFYDEHPRKAAKPHPSR